MSAIDNELKKLVGKESPEDVNYIIDDKTTAIDVDTFETFIDGERKVIRLAGASGPETFQVRPDGTFKQAEAGGEEAHALAAALAREGGFTDVRLTGREGEFDRELGDLVNPETGESLIQKGLESGFYQTSKYSSQEQVVLESLGAAEKRIEDADEWDLAAEALNGYKSVRPLEAKPWAASALEYSKAPGAYRGAAIIPEGVYENNEAKNFIGASWDVATSSFAEGWYGTADMLQDSFTSWDNTDTWGQRNLDRLEYEQSRGPSTAFLDPFDEEGKWKLDSFSDYAKFTIGNLVVSAPYMANTFAAVVAAPFTAGLSFASPLSVYTGQIYAGQAEGKKNPMVALLGGAASTALDALGVKTVGLGRDLLFNKNVRNQAIKEIAESKNISLEAADQMLTTATKRELAAASTAFKDYLATQTTFRNLGINVSSDVVTGGAGEALTEATQELIAAIGEASGDLSSIKLEDLERRLITGAIAGGSLGGGISGIGAVSSSLGDYDAFRSYEQELKEKAKDTERQENDKKWQIETGQGDGTIVRSRDEVAQDLTKEAQGAGFQTDNDTLQNQSAPAVKAGKGKNIIGKLKDYYKHRGILQGTTQGYITSLAPEFADRGRVLSGLFSAWGAHNGNTGPTQDQSYRVVKASLDQTINNGVQDQAKFGTTERAVSDMVNDPEVISALKAVAKLWADPSNPHSTFAEVYENSDVPRIPDRYEAQVKNLLEKGQELEIYEAAVAQREGRPYASGSFYDWEPYNKDRIEYDRKSIVDAAIAGGADPKEAHRILDEILLDDDIQSEQDLDDGGLFGEQDIGEGDYIKEKIKKTKDAVRKALGQSDYKSNDLYYKQESRSSAVASKYANEKYFDRDGNNIAGILNLAEAEGEIDAEEKAFLAKEFMDAMEIRKGSYNRIDPSLRKVQNHLMFFSATSVLPLAAVSSLVETATLNLGLTPDQIYKQIIPLLKNTATEVTDYMNTGASKIHLVNRSDQYGKNAAKQLNKSLGYETTAASARLRQEAAGNKGWQQWLLDGFFKAIFLGPWTNVLRMTAAGSGADVIFGWANNIVFDREQGKETVLGRESRDALTELGINVDRLINMMEADKQGTTLANLMRQKGLGDVDMDAEMLRMEDELRHALIAFVDNRVAHPTKTNRPKLYYDERYKIFFHYQGFVSAFTSDILPKLYKNLVRGTPGLKYNAFMTIGSLLAIGFLSQLLKDEIKYGEPSPWLQDWKLFQRALHSSGLLGVGERAVNIAYPLYNSRTDGAFDWLLDRGLGEAPTLGYAAGIGEAAQKFAEGETASGVRQGSKAIPLLGPFYGVRKDLGELAAEIFGE